jgi:hypothetical protein
MTPPECLTEGLLPRIDAPRAEMCSALGAGLLY